MARYSFRLAISPARLLAYYRGEAAVVSVVASGGQRIQFPASRLRPLARRDGVYGHFELEVSAEGRFVGLNRLGD